MEYYIHNFSTSTEGVNPSVVCHVVFDRSPERTKKTLALTRAFSVFSTHYRRGWDEGVCCTLRPLDATKITTQWTIKVKPKTMQTSSSVNERSECNLSPKRLQTSAGTSRGFLLHTRTRTQTLSGLFPPRPCPSSPHAALSARRDEETQWVQCRRDWPRSRDSPEYSIERPLAGRLDGWLPVNTPDNKQQHRLYIIPTEREGGDKKKHPLWMGINPCRIIPVISNNSASIWEQGNKKKKRKAWLCYQWRAARLILLWYLG